MRVFPVLVRTLAGNGTSGAQNGIGTQATFNAPTCVAVSRSGVFALVSDRSNSLVRRIDLASAQVTVLAGSGVAAFADGTGTLAAFDQQEGIAISSDDAFAYIVDGYGVNHRLRRVAIATGEVITLAGNGSAGALDAVGTFATFNKPRGIAISPNDAFLLVVDALNYRIRRIDLVSLAVTVIAGSIYGYADGTGTSAKFNGMYGIAIDPASTFALICDWGNHQIRRLDLVSNAVTTLVGSTAGTAGYLDGIGTSALLRNPHAVSIDPTGTVALLLDLDTIACAAFTSPVCKSPRSPAAVPRLSRTVLGLSPISMARTGSPWIRIGHSLWLQNWATIVCVLCHSRLCALSVVFVQQPVRRRRFRRHAMLRGISVPPARHHRRKCNATLVSPVPPARSMCAAHPMVKVCLLKKAHIPTTL